MVRLFSIQWFHLRLPAPFSIDSKDEQPAISVRRILRWRNSKMSALLPELILGLTLPGPVAFVLADRDDVALKVIAVKPLYRFSNTIFSFHFDQRDSPALLGIPTSDDRDRGDLSNRGKMVTQLNLIRVVRQITDVQFCFQV
jgi:hypothetical protein